MKVGVHFNASREGAEATAAQIQAAGGEAVLLGADLSRREEAGRLVDEAIEALGGLDVLALSAANFERVAFDEVDFEAWDRAMRLNLEAPFAMAHRARGALAAARGSIVFVTCVSATMPYKSYLPYVVSKGALRQLMRVMALEMAPDVRVNAVAPGTVLAPDQMSAEEVARLARRIPLGHVGEAEDAADAVLYLARAPFVTGQELVVDGGRTLTLAPREIDGRA